MMRPQEGDYNSFYQGYIDRVIHLDVMAALAFAHEKTLNTLESIPEEKGSFRYAEGKWSIKEVIGHIIDCERIMAYRALRFARADTTPLEGFDENLYAPNSNVDPFKVKELVDHLKILRVSTVDLFMTFSDEMLNRKGLANESSCTVLALGYIIGGHALHHCNVLTERYL